MRKQTNKQKKQQLVFIMTVHELSLYRIRQHTVMDRSNIAG